MNIRIRSRQTKSHISTLKNSTNQENNLKDSDIYLQSTFFYFNSDKSNIKGMKINKTKLLIEEKKLLTNTIGINNREFQNQQNNEILSTNFMYSNSFFDHIHFFRKTIIGFDEENRRDFYSKFIKKSTTKKMIKKRESFKKSRSELPQNLKKLKIQKNKSVDDSNQSVSQQLSKKSKKNISIQEQLSEYLENLKFDKQTLRYNNISLQNLKNFVLNFMLFQELDSDLYRVLDYEEKKIFGSILQKKKFDLQKYIFSKKKLSFENIKKLKNKDVLKHYSGKKMRLVLKAFQKFEYEKWWNKNKHTYLKNLNDSSRENKMKKLNAFFLDLYDNEWVWQSLAKTNSLARGSYVPVDINKLNEKKDSIDNYVDRLIKSPKAVLRLQNFLKMDSEGRTSIFLSEYEHIIISKVTNKFNKFEKILKQVDSDDKAQAFKWIIDDFLSNQKAKFPHSLKTAYFAQEYFKAKYFKIFNVDKSN